VIIRFLANRNWDANKSAAAPKEDFGQDAYALITVQGWLVDIRRGRQNLRDLQRSGRLPPAKFLSPWKNRGLSPAIPLL
jgi:hypothetical protein